MYICTFVCIINNQLLIILTMQNMYQQNFDINQYVRKRTDTPQFKFYGGTLAVS